MYYKSYVFILQSQTIYMFEKSDNANKININMKGINTSNHENEVAPPLHITFNSQVQNTIYTALKMKI